MYKSQNFVHLESRGATYKRDATSDTHCVEATRERIYTTHVLRLLHTYGIAMRLRRLCAFGASFMRRSVHTFAIVGLCNVASEFSWFCDACDRVGLNSALSRHRSVQVVMDSRPPGTEFSVVVVYFLFVDMLGH